MRRVILNIHGLGLPRRPLDPGEAAYWVEPDLFEAALDLAERLAEQVRTDVTFDDGNLSDVEIGAPALKRRGRTAAFFVLADRIDATGSLGQSEIRALVADGHTVGSHGAAHIDWRTASDEQLDRELVTARDTIARAAGRAVDAAAIPFGRWNRRVLGALRRAGYARAYSSDGGSWRPGDFPIPRTSLRSDTTIQDVECLLLGRESARRRLRRTAAMQLKRWI